MRCKEAQDRSSAYLDGELSDEASSAVRGHLRQCTACEQRFAQEAAIVDLAASLDPLEPPESVWEGISQKIAEAEIEDSEQHPAWRWLSGHMRPLLLTGLVGCAAAAALWMLWATSSDAPLAVVESRGASNANPNEAEPSPTPTTVTAMTELEMEEADRDYLETIEELRALLQEDREQWSPPVAAAIDAKLDGFRRVSQEQTLAIANTELAVASRDPVYATYRAEIAFLQSTLAGDLPLVEALP